MVSLSRDALADKVLEGGRISPEEALQLYSLPLEELGVLAKVGAQKDVDFRALRLTFQKIEGDWLITRAETIKMPR